MPTQRRQVIDHLPAYELAANSVPAGVRLIQLGQNELGIAPSPRAVEAIRRSAGQITRYPDTDHVELRQAIADVNGLNSNLITCGAGSMELMGLLTTAYAQPGCEVIVSEYGYKYFRVQCAIAGASVKVVPETNMRADVEAMARAVSEQTRLVFLVDPNNPTGWRMPPGSIAKLRRALPPEVLLIVDGAYADFIVDMQHENGFALVDNGDNVAVLRTFSKAYGLAGVRVGWLYAPTDVIDTVNRIRPPNSISTHSLAAAQAAVRDTDHVAGVVREVNRTRDAFCKRISALGLGVSPSAANFVLVHFDPESQRSASRIYAALLSQGLIVRPMQSYDLPDSLRVTVGSSEEMDLLADALKKLV